MIMIELGGNFLPKLTVSTSDIVERICGERSLLEKYIKTSIGYSIPVRVGIISEISEAL